MPVNSPRREYLNMLPRWQRDRDCFEGSDSVKAAGTKYLPMLDSHRVSGMTGVEKYEDYKLRALFFNAMGRTVEGMAGALFQTAPMFEGSEQLGEQLEDVTLSGVSAETFGLQVAREVLTTGRYGILVDMPQDERPGAIETRPYWCGYRAEDVVSWMTTRSLGRETLVRLVLAEVDEEQDPGDPFVMLETPQFRVLELLQDVYTQSIWRKKPRSDEYEEVSRFVPTRRGTAFPFIPFTFVGPTSTSALVTKPPLDDLAVVNLSHYRTMAQLEHGRHYTALPTPWVAGATGLKPGQQLVIGSGVAWSLEKEGRAGMLEFTGAGLGHLATAEKDKREMMASLGARLLETMPSVRETEVSVETRHSGDIATLRTVAQSLERALTFTLRFHEWWIGADPDPSDLTGTAFELNKDFFTTKMTADDLRSLIGALQAETISYATFYAQLAKGEIARPGVTAEEEQAEIQNDVANAAAAAAPAGAGMVYEDPSSPTGYVDENGSPVDQQGNPVDENGNPVGSKSGDQVTKTGNPYRIVKRGKKWLVIKADDGKVMGTHPSKEDAMKQLAALHFNVKE